MKIVFGHQIFSVQKYGGISRYFYELANQINNTSSNNIEIFSPLYINEYFIYNDEVRPQGIKLIAHNKVGQVITRLNSLASQFVLRPRNNIDIYHQTYYSNIVNYPKSAANIVTVFDMVHEKFPDMFTNNDKSRQKKINSVNRADHIICISKNTQKDLIELLGIPEEKTSVVYLGNSLMLKDYADKVPDESKPFILFVGKRYGYKNFKNLLIAYANSQMLKNQFSIICFGGGLLLDEEIELISSLNIDNNSIKYIEGDDNILSSLYASAAVFVYPSLYEGFGIPPLEAMSHGCPVVCSNTSSIPEVVGDAGVFFDPLEPIEISEAIEKVVSSSALSNKLIKSGFDRAKKFSWKECAEQTIKIYENVI